MAASNTRRTNRQNEDFIAYITVKTMPEIIQNLIPNDVKPAFICTSYRHNKDKYITALKLSDKEQKILSNLSSDGFHKCDTPLLYKLCQYYNFVTAPSEGWGKVPIKLENIGDAVDALVRLRKEIILNSNQDFKSTFDRMVEIAKVVDKELPTDKRFEHAVKSLVVDTFDEKYFDELKTAFQQITEEATHGAHGSFEDDVLEVGEPMSFLEDHHTNVLQNKIVLSPALFENAGKDYQTGIKYINELTDKIRKQASSKGKEVHVLNGSRKRKRNSMLAQHDPHSFNQLTDSLLKQGPSKELLNSSKNVIKV